MHIHAADALLLIGSAHASFSFAAVFNPRQRLRQSYRVTALLAGGPRLPRHEPRHDIVTGVFKRPWEPWEQRSPRSHGSANGEQYCMHEENDVMCYWMPHAPGQNMTSHSRSLKDSTGLPLHTCTTLATSKLPA
jgi:hypothetical protein